MSFFAVGDHNAIVEVVFGLTFSRPFTQNEADALLVRHNEVKEELPRVQRNSSPPFGINIQTPAGVIMPSLPVALAFDRMKPDGNLEWRLRLEGNTIFVNCLAYPGWPAAWDRSRRYLNLVLDAASSDDNAAQTFILQYINMFEWRGYTQYDLNALLRRDSGFPSEIFENGHLWHSYRGWFSRDAAVVSGRRLERLHLDGIENEVGIPSVKIDTYLQLQLDESIPSRQLSADRDIGQAAFEALHDRAKDLLGSVLHSSVIEQLGLYAPYQADG